MLQVKNSFTKDAVEPCAGIYAQDVEVGQATKRLKKSRLAWTQTCRLQNEA